MSEAELFKQMEQGKLVSSEVLPKVAKAYKEAALEGGAYEKSLQGLRVTEGQMMTQLQRSGNTIFTSGFEGGLSNLFNSLSESLEDLEPQLKKIGYWFGKVFDGIAYSLDLLTPVLQLAIDHFYILFGTGMLVKIQAIGKALGAAFLPLTAALLTAEELVSFFTDKVAGITERAMGTQFNLMTLQKSVIEYDKDGNMVKGASQESAGLKGIKDAYGWASSLTNFANQGYSNLIGDVTIEVNGVSDPQEAAKYTKWELEQVFSGAYQGAST